MNSSSDTDPVYDAQCIVCLKTVRDGDSSICHFNFEHRWVTICCPLCFEAFEIEPRKYLARRIPPREDKPSLP